MPVQADGQADHDADDTQDGSHGQGSTLTVHEEAEQDGHDDEQQGDHSHGGVGLVERAVSIEANKGAGHDGGEGGHHQDQGQIREDQEQLLGAVADVHSDNLTDGLALVADRSEQSAVVMDSAEEDTADQDPQHHGHPAKDSGLDGTVDGAGAGDGGKVVTHQNRSLGGDVVHTVLQFVGRGDLGVVNTPLLGKPSAVEHVAYDQNDNANDYN